MAVDTRELREKRAKLHKDCQAILDKAEAEKRATNAEEDGQYEKLWAEVEDLGKQIERNERANRLEEAREADRMRQEEEDQRRKKQQEDDEQRNRLPADYDSEEEEIRSTAAYHSGFSKRLTGRGTLSEEETRAQIAGKGEKGGYLYASEKFVMDLLKDVDDMTPFRGMSNVLDPIPGNDSVGVPTLTSDMSDATWTSELGVPTRDTLKFGKRALTPHPLAKEIVLSKVLVRKAPNIINIVRQRLAYRVGTAEENGFMTGTGNQQALGIFTASADGLNTGQDNSTANTTTQVMADNIIDATFSIKQAYWRNASWLMHRIVMKQIAKLKDGDGQYLLRTDMLGAGTPVNQLAGFPVTLSEFAPSTMTTGKYVYVFGDFNYYWIVDGLEMEVVRLEELYARQNQDCFIIRATCDGMPVLQECFQRGKLA